MRQYVFKRRFGGYKALLCVNIKGGAACTVQGVVVFVYIMLFLCGYTAAICIWKRRRYVYKASLCVYNASLFCVFKSVLCVNIKGTLCI